MAQLRAIFFDQDGVIIDTEKDGHRVAFNQAFRETGHDFHWGVEEYHRLLAVAGGKERIRHFLQGRPGFADMGEAELDRLIKDMHALKTERFVSLIQAHKLPLRSGVERFMREAKDAGMVMGICTTANQRSARAVRAMLPGMDFALVLAGDVVKKKKPDPEIYELALAKTGMAPESCLVIEDSANGVAAAKAAGLTVLATTNRYTEREDLSRADVVVSRLGDPSGKQGELVRAAPPLAFDGVLTVEQIAAWFERR